MFFGLGLLPVRGSGTDKRIDKTVRVRDRARQRGWHLVSDGRFERRFHWPAWNPSLDSDAIDALLDLWNWKDHRRWAKLGIHAGWRTVRYRPKGREVKSGYASEKL